MGNGNRHRPRGGEGKEGDGPYIPSTEKTATQFLRESTKEQSGLFDELNAEITNLESEVARKGLVTFSDIDEPVANELKTNLDEIKAYNEYFLASAGMTDDELAQRYLEYLSHYRELIAETKEKVADLAAILNSKQGDGVRGDVKEAARSREGIKLTIGEKFYEWTKKANEEMEILVKTYQKILPKGVTLESLSPQLHFELQEKLQKLDNYVVQTRKLPLDTAGLDNVLKIREEKIKKLMDEIKHIIDTYEEFVLPVTDTSKSEKIKTRTKKEAAEVNNDVTKTSYENLEGDIYNKVNQEALDEKNRILKEASDKKNEALDKKNEQFEKGIYAPIVGMADKRSEINAKRAEWKQLKEELESTENEFRVMEREQFVQAGKRAPFDRVFTPVADTTEMAALRDKLRLVKVRYIKNVQENAVLRQEEKVFREAAQSPTWTPSEPRKEGTSVRPREKDPERDLQHSFAKRFIVEAAQKTLDTKKEVEAERSWKITRMAQEVMSRISQMDPAKRKAVVWGGRIVGLVAVSGAAAFMAPAIAGTAAAGAAVSYAARLAGGMAGGGLSGYLANKFYGRFTNRAEEQFTTAKAANVAAFGKNDLSDEAFKAMENTYVSAKENFRVSQRNRNVFTAGAAIAGSFGAASLTELAPGFGRSLVNPNAAPGIEAASAHGEPYPPNVAPFIEPGIGEIPPVPSYIEVPDAPREVSSDPVLRDPLPREGEALRPVASAESGTPFMYDRPGAPPPPRVGPEGLAPRTVRFVESNGTVISNDQLLGGPNPYHTPSDEAVQPTQLPERFAPRSPEIVRIRSGDNLWRLTNQRYAGDFQGIPHVQRDRILSEIFNEIQASPEARQTLGIRSGRVGLIYPNENLNFSDIHDRLQAKIENYRLRNNLPLPTAVTPPAAMPLESAPVRLNVQLPEEMQRSGEELRTQIERLGVHNDNAADTTIVAGAIPSRLEVPLETPLPPPNVPVFREQGMSNLPPLPEYVDVPPAPTTGRLEVMRESTNATDMPSHLEVPLETSFPASPSDVPVFREQGMKDIPPLPGYVDVLPQPPAYVGVPLPPQTGRLPVVIENPHTESIPIRVPAVEVPPAIETPPLLDPAEMIPGRAHLEVPWFARLAQEVYGDVESFKVARENMINGVVPVYNSWFDSLVGNKQGSFVKMMGEYTLDEFDAFAALSRSDLIASLRIDDLTLTAYNEWHQMIDQMRQELQPSDPALTINELINYYLVLNPEVYRLDPTRR